MGFHVSFLFSKSNSLVSPQFYSIPPDVASSPHIPISSGSYRSFPQILFIPLNDLFQAPIQQSFPANLKVRPPMEEGRLASELHSFLLFNKFNPPVSSTALWQTSCCELSSLIPPISSGSCRSSFNIPFCYSLLYPRPQLQQTFPRNVQVTPARETGSLIMNPCLSPIFFKIKIPVSSLFLQQIICCNLPFLSAISLT